MVLQHQWAGGSCARKLRRHRGISQNRNMVLNQHAIVQHRERARLHFTIGSRLGRMEYDVVGLVI